MYNCVLWSDCNFIKIKPPCLLLFELGFYYTWEHIHQTLHWTKTVLHCKQLLHLKCVRQWLLRLSNTDCLVVELSWLGNENEQSTLLQIVLFADKRTLVLFEMMRLRWWSAPGCEVKFVLNNCFLGVLPVAAKTLHGRTLCSYKEQYWLWKSLALSLSLYVCVFVYLCVYVIMNMCQIFYCTHTIRLLSSSVSVCFFIVLAFFLYSFVALSMHLLTSSAVCTSTCFCFVFFVVVAWPSMTQLFKRINWPSCWMGSWFNCFTFFQYHPRLQV